MYKNSRLVIVWTGLIQRDDFAQIPEKLQLHSVHWIGRECQYYIQRTSIFQHWAESGCFLLTFYTAFNITYILRGIRLSL
jgi:hypothetical protein